MMSKSSTTTESEWLHNPHAGDLLMSEFMEPLGLDSAVLVDAEPDLRLGRYFRMSEGFFLGLQVDYEIRKAKRALMAIPTGSNRAPLENGPEAIMHHKRGRARNRRAGCKLCKPWKANGVRSQTYRGEKFSDHRRRISAT